MARKTKAEAEETRERILDAAERLFLAHGVMQTSLEQIAEAAGVTRGAIYWHFADKVQLFHAMHERIRLPQEDMVEQAAASGHADPLGLLHRIAIDCLKTLAADERRQRVFTILLFRCEYVGTMVRALNRQKDANAQMRANVVRIFTMASENGTLSPAWTPQIAAMTFEALVTGLFMNWLRFDHGFDLVNVGSGCLDNLFRTFRNGSALAVEEMARAGS